VKWLNRDLIVGPYLCLCTSERDYHRVLRHCRVPVAQWDRWVSDGADATTHILANPNGGMVCVVAISVPPDKTPVQVAAMLVHEAVHVWQQHCRSIGEREPSEEFEAYSIQTIAQRLMQAFADLRA
jgi:hypothetical protein